MKSWSLTIFSYFLISQNLAIGLTRCDSNSNQKCLKTGGMITPAWRIPIPDVDIILEVGTPLEIYCTLDLNHKHAENYTYQDIIFKKGDRKIDSKHITFVNSTTARLFLETSTISVQTEIFACLLTLHGGRNNATSDVSNSSDSGTEMLLNNNPETTQEDLICSSSVRIGSTPKKVVNFKCLSHNWDVLDCWWHEPNNGITTGYSIYYSIPGDAGENQLYGCPTDQSEPGHCRWTKETSPPYKVNFEFVNFYINGSNMFGNITQKFRWHHYTHIIPAQPCNLTLLRTTSHSVCLQWDDVSSKNASLINLPYLYSIKCKRPSSKSWNVIYFHSKDIEKENDRVQVNITGIKYPNMEYKFHVYVKFDVSKKNPWSKAASVVVKTSACAPYRSPKTDPGGFEVFAKYSNHRNAIIYWKQIPNEEHNGDNFLYRIIVFENDEKVNITPTSMNNFSATFSNLSFNAYKFYIRSVNAIGSAPRSSIVYVPTQNDILPRPNPDYMRFDGTDIYEIKVLSGLLEFKHTFRQIQVTNFTLFWCESNHGDPYPCSNVFNWINLPVNNIIKHNFAFKHNVTLNQHMGYQFAVSTNSLNSSSGMHWIMFTGIYNQVNKIQNVWIQQVGSSFVDIHWKLEFANWVKGFRGYKISNCPVNENQHDCVESTEKHHTYYADANTSDLNFTDLMPNITYKMAVAIWTDELLGPWSEWMYPRTKNAT